LMITKRSRQINMAAQYYLSPIAKAVGFFIGNT